MKTMNMNPYKKLRDKDNPYEVWNTDGIEYRVIQAYEDPITMSGNPDANWLCYVVGRGLENVPVHMVKKGIRRR